ncbi:MAG: hypothetical protein GX200_03970 [Firmicutes bacterium]|nr:hypothetical protein [Bacillota bacterium]
MRLWTLIKQQLNVAFSLSALRWYARHDRKKIAGGIAIAAVVIASLVPLYFSVYLKFLEAVFFAGLNIGQPEILLTLTLVFTSFVVFFIGIAFVMSTFYFSRDLSLLVPLPVTPGEIVGAKFAVVLVQEYLLVVPLLLPAIIIYGLHMGAGIAFFLAGLVVLLLVPVLPLAVVSAVTLLLMRVTNLGRYKDFLRLVGMVLLVVFLLGINVLVTKLAPMAQEEMLALLLEEEGLTRFIARLFPPALLAARALTAGGAASVLNFLGYLALNLAGVALTKFLGERLFYRGLIGGEEVSARKSVSLSRLERKMAKVSSPAAAIAAREIKLLVRTPIYLFNSIGILVIVPVALLLPLLMGDAVDPLLAIFLQPGNRFFVNLAGAAFIAIMGAFTPASSSSFSREGKQFWLSQVIPVPPAVQIRGKILYSLLLCLLAVPLVILLSVFFTKWSPLELLLVIVLGLCGCLPPVTSSLLIDLLRPYLDWDNPQRAIKQNMNVVLGMAAAALCFWLLYLLGKYLYGAGLPEYRIYAALAIAALLLGYIPYLVMLQIADRRYRDIVSP